MKIKVCLLLIFGFLFFLFSKAEASITWTTDNFDYNATDAGGYYYTPSTAPVILGASSDRSQVNGDSENSAVATAVEPQQGVSTPGLSMSSGAWGNSFQDLTQDSGGATVYAYADNTYALDNSVGGIYQNGQRVSSFIDRYFTVDTDRTYILSASALAPLDWSGTASGSATAPQPNLTGGVYLIQTDPDGVTTTVESSSLSDLLSSPQQTSVSLVAGDTYQLVVALSNVTSLGGEDNPAGIVSSFNNLDVSANPMGNIDGNFNAGTQADPVTITASLAPPTPVLLQGATDLGSGWYSSWFGTFYATSTTSNDWIYHQTLGWLYPFATSADDIWFWDQSMNAFWWTSQTAYPFIYRASDGAWLYYAQGTSDPRWFYNFSTGLWEAD